MDTGVVAWLCEIAVAGRSRRVVTVLPMAQICSDAWWARVGADGDQDCSAGPGSGRSRVVARVQRLRYIAAAREMG